MTTDLTDYQRYARAFQIFGEYPDMQMVSAEHDVIWAGPDPSGVSAEHTAELETLGWHPEPRYNTFRKFP